MIREFTTDMIGKRVEIVLVRALEGSSAWGNRALPPPDTIPLATGVLRGLGALSVSDLPTMVAFVHVESCDPDARTINDLAWLLPGFTVPFQLGFIRSAFDTETVAAIMMRPLVHQGAGAVESSSDAQPMPTPTGGAAIADMIIADVRQRDEQGVRTYGTRLQANNGRNSLWDAYEEVLDLAMYIRQKLEEERLAK